MRSALLLAALLTAQSPNGDAQASRLTPGTRIRLTHMYFCSSDVSGTVDCTTAARGAAGVSFALLNTGGSNSLCDRSANQDAISSSECIGLAALGGIAGAGLGAVIGGLVRTERWQNVPLEHLRVNLTPHAGSKSGLAVVF